MILRLTGFELKKLMSATFLKILSALLLILNIALAARAAYKPVRDEDKYYENVYAIYNASPEFFFSEYDRIKREFDSLGPFESPSASYGGVYLDMTLFGDVYDTVTADEAYHKKIEGILTQARSICDNYLANGMEDSYVYGYHLRVIDRYTYLYENVKLDNRPVSGWDKYFGNKAGYFTVFILLAAIGVYAVLADRQCGFYSVAGACRNGRAKTAAAKLIAAALAATAVVLVFTLSSFAAVGIAARGYSSPDNAAQAALSLQLLPLKLDFKGAFFADLALKIVSAVVFCMLAVLISSAVKQISACISLGIGLAVLNFLISRADEVRFGAWKFLNLYSAYSLAEYAPKYRSVDVLSRPVGLTAVAAAAAVILTATAVLLSCVLYSKGAPFKFLARGAFRRSSAGERAGAGRKAARRGSLSLTFYELYKQRAVYALFAALFAVKLFASAEYYTPRTSVYDAALKNYINKIGGEFTDEKADLIMREYASCEEIAARFDEVRLDWWNGKISDETYNDMFGEYMSALTDREALRYLAEMSVYLETLRDERGIVGSYVYDTGYYKFASQGVDRVLIIFAAVIGCRSYLCENVKNASGTPMLVICGTAARGRGQLFLRKSAVCACSSFCAWLMCRSADAFFFLRAYELPDMSAPLLSMPRYGDTALDLTVAEYTALTAAVSLIGTLTLSLLCLALGIFVKRAIAAYAVAAAVLAVPALAARTGITAAGYFDLTALYDADRLYITSPPFLTPPAYGVCVFAAAACAAVSLTVYFHRRSEVRGL